MITRVCIWFNCLNSSHRITPSVGNHTEGWGHIQRDSPCTDRESTGTCTNRRHTQGWVRSGVTSRGGSAIPDLCAGGAPELLALLGTLTFRAARAAAASLSAAVLGVLPHYLSMATAAQRSPATSYANESRPQMSAATTAPSPSLLSLLLKVTVVRYPDSAFENTFPTF